jgi:large repetitive protein
MTMKTILILLFLPFLAVAQPPPLQFQLQPGAFPVTVNGFQTFQPWAGGDNPTTPEFCDLDGDRDLDYFTGSQVNYYWFFQNTGSANIPNFQYVSCTFDSLYPICPGYASESDIDFADMDGDGDFDALLCNGIIGIARNTGTNTQWNFAVPETLFTTSNQYLIATNMVATDIDGDGDKDIFAGTWYSGGLTYYKNIGTPQNYQFQQITQNWQGIQVTEGKGDPCFGDMDADGDLDLLIGTGQGHVLYYRNDGSPTNPQMTLISTTYLGIDVQKDASPELADIDGDGDLDLFVGRSPLFGQEVTQGDVYFYRNDGTARNPSFTYITSNYMTWDCGGYSRPLLADINGDSLPDLLSRIGSHLIYYRNIGTSGNPSFVYESSSLGDINIFDIMPWFTDINGDGKMDFFAGTSAIPGPPGLQLYLNQGTPQVPNWVGYSSNLVPGVFNQGSVLLSPWTADIDADGDQDLFVTDDNGYLYFFRNIGTPTHLQFQYETNNWQGLNDGNGAHRFGCFWDMDGDGDLDMFMNDPWLGHLRFYRNMGTPQSASMVMENNDFFPDFEIWHASPFVTDIDQDGDGDLFVGDQWGGIRFFRNITGESPVNPDPKYHPQPQRQITILPNPGNSGTTISYVLSHPQHVNLSVYNLLGARITTLVNGLQQPGSHVTSWDAKGRASGIYLVRFTSPEWTTTQKVVIVK